MVKYSVCRYTSSNDTGSDFDTQITPSLIVPFSTLSVILAGAFGCLKLCLGNVLIPAFNPVGVFMWPQARWCRLFFVAFPIYIISPSGEAYIYIPELAPIPSPVTIMPRFLSSRQSPIGGRVASKGKLISTSWKTSLFFEVNSLAASNACWKFIFICGEVLLNYLTSYYLDRFILYARFDCKARINVKPWITKRYSLHVRHDKQIRILYMHMLPIDLS